MARYWENYFFHYFFFLFSFFLPFKIKTLKINFLWKSSCSFVLVFTPGVNRGRRTGIAKKKIMEYSRNFSDL